MFELSRHNIFLVFVISQGYHELRQETIRANEIIYHIFTPNDFKDVQNLYQDKTSMDLTLNEFKLTTAS